MTHGPWSPRADQRALFVKSCSEKAVQRGLLLPRPVDEHPKASQVVIARLIYWHPLRVSSEAPDSHRPAELCCLPSPCSDNRHAGKGTTAILLLVPCPQVPVRMEVICTRGVWKASGTGECFVHRAKARHDMPFNILIKKHLCFYLFFLGAVLGLRPELTLKDHTFTTW